MTQVVITQLNNQRFLLIYEEDELVECHPLQEEISVQKETMQEDSLPEKALAQKTSTLRIWNIYIGRVEKVVKNIQSAFVRLDGDNVGYLPLNDKPAVILNRKLPKGLPSIAEGDKILVQVEQEPQKMKQARVTGNICLSGNYVALDLSGGHVGVSKKIVNASRVSELKELISAEQGRPNDALVGMGGSIIADNNSTSVSQQWNKFYGCVLRTACENALNEAILDEYRHLCGELEEILNKAHFERNTGLIRSGASEWMFILGDYGMERVDEIKTDLPDVYEELKSSGIGNELVFYEDKEYPLFKLLSLETELQKLLSKKIWLKSGGFLVIEPTEAMVVIDVNSGKSIGKKNKDSHILKVNLEAAEEITKQLRLRNLSGIIMVDFINMSQDGDKQQVVKCLERGLKKDKVPGYFVEITKLDLFELTRKKVRRPLHEVIV